MFNPSHPHITIPSPTGPLTRNIRPSFPANADKVVRELNALFAEQARSSTSPPPTSAPSPGTWHLDATCDAISAFFVLCSHQDVHLMVRQVLDAAEGLKHHPSISVLEGAGGSWVLLATCGTHRPAGLSVKDPRLARKIGEIAESFVLAGQGGEEIERMDGLVDWHWRENMGRARVSMEDPLEEIEADGKGADEQRYWRMNTTEHIEVFEKSGGKKESAVGNIPTLRGLVL
jgi:pterin-4a-carbinolamine dehydratase